MSIEAEDIDMPSGTDRDTLNKIQRLLDKPAECGAPSAMVTEHTRLLATLQAQLNMEIPHLQDDLRELKDGQRDLMEKFDDLMDELSKKVSNVDTRVTRLETASQTRQNLFTAASGFVGMVLGYITKILTGHM